MFLNTDPAADSAVASFVTLLATAEAIGKVKQQLADFVQEQPIMFALLNGVRQHYSFLHLDVQCVSHNLGAFMSWSICLNKAFWSIYCNHF